MNRWEDKQVAFFGKITAGITHEMKNVLAIIRESSGLMEDIMSISPEAVIKHQEKIQNSLARIKDQIKRGVELTDRLNKFAHSTDETIAKIDLQEAVEHLTTLAQRFARLKNVVLKTGPAEEADPDGLPARSFRPAGEGQASEVRGRSAQGAYPRQTQKGLPKEPEDHPGAHQARRR